MALAFAWALPGWTSASGCQARIPRPRGSPRLATIEVVGSVRDIINGVVRPEHAHRILDATAFRTAFLVGSPRGLESMGEMICANGHAFTCSTDPADLHQTLSDTYCWTTGACSRQLAHPYWRLEARHIPCGRVRCTEPSHHLLAFRRPRTLTPACATAGACILPRDAAPSRTLSVGGSEDAQSGGVRGAAPAPRAAWAEVCASAVRASSADGGAVVFCGIVRFSRLSAIQIAAAPIHGESIFDRRDRYYAVPPVELEGASCFVFGAAAATDSVERDIGGAGLGRILYSGATGVAGRHAQAGSAGADDLGSGPAVLHHTHAVRLASGVSTERDISPDGVLGVYHVSGDSEVQWAKLDCFDMDAVVDHEAGLQYVPRACC